VEIIVVIGSILIMIIKIKFIIVISINGSSINIKDICKILLKKNFILEIIVVIDSIFIVININSSSIIIKDTFNILLKKNFILEIIVVIDSILIMIIKIKFIIVIVISNYKQAN